MVLGVVGLLVALVAQGVVDFRSTTEAFPTISMPSFEGAPNPDGHRTIEKLTIQATYDDGTVREPDAEALFEQFHYSSARFSIDHLLKNPPELDDETIDWLREQAARMGDGATPVLLTFTWQPYDLDVRSVEGVPVGEAQVTKVAL